MFSIQNADSIKSIEETIFYTTNIADYNINNLNVNTQTQLNQYFQVYNPIINNIANPLTADTYKSPPGINYINLGNSLTIIDTKSGAVSATITPGQTNQMLTVSLVNGTDPVTLTIQDCFYNNTAHVNNNTNVQISTSITKIIGSGSITLTPNTPTVTLLNSMSVTGIIPQPNGLWVVISGAHFTP